MRDSLSLGPTPSGETCQQVGSDSYSPRKAVNECREYIAQLTRIFGTPPGTADFCITSNTHDFGTYRDVAVRYDDNSEEESDFAFKVEANCPELWDDIAKANLAKLNEGRV